MAAVTSFLLAISATLIGIILIIYGLRGTLGNKGTMRTRGKDE